MFLNATFGYRHSRLASIAISLLRADAFYNAWHKVAKSLRMQDPDTPVAIIKCIKGLFPGSESHLKFLIEELDKVCCFSA